MIRGAKNDVPAKKPAKKTGMFSGKGSQKMDPVNQPDITKKTLAEAYSRKGRKVASS